MEMVGIGRHSGIRGVRWSPERVLSNRYVLKYFGVTCTACSQSSLLLYAAGASARLFHPEEHVPVRTALGAIQVHAAIPSAARGPGASRVSLRALSPASPAKSVGAAAKRKFRGVGNNRVGRHAGHGVDDGVTDGHRHSYAAVSRRAWGLALRVRVTWRHRAALREDDSKAAFPIRRTDPVLSGQDGSGSS